MDESVGAENSMPALEKQLLDQVPSSTSDPSQTGGDLVDRSKVIVGLKCGNRAVE
ncbi:hypothetical protein [Mycolicibacterium mucogenicum]|jgi:hypothetical protein|uniref:hypothetical protein n=1 Tax=Mycolicibacterium mucogenicum TaxID=56689 RepID=UPI000A924972|nr:hypothetical protein [Mycolicibacterium mucogenicum]